MENLNLCIFVKSRGQKVKLSLICRTVLARLLIPLLCFRGASIQFDEKPANVIETTCSDEAEKEEDEEDSTAENDSNGEE